MTSPPICSPRKAGLQVLPMHSSTHTTGKALLLLLPHTQNSGIILPTAPGNCAGVLLNKDQYFFIDPIKFYVCFRTCLRNGDALGTQVLYLMQIPAELMQNSCSIRNYTTKSTYKKIIEFWIFKTCGCFHDLVLLQREHQYSWCNSATSSYINLYQKDRKNTPT